MAFKEGVTDEDVNQFRSIVTKAKELDDAVDTGLLTPQEAFDELAKFGGSVGFKSKVKQSETKRDTHTR